MFCKKSSPCENAGKTGLFVARDFSKNGLKAKNRRGVRCSIDERESLEPDEPKICDEERSFICSMNIISYKTLVGPR
jgi:hypothetical protein